MTNLEKQADAILAKNGWPDNVLSPRQLRRIYQEREISYASPDPIHAGIYGRTHVPKGGNDE
jgi:hypothetical protein